MNISNASCFCVTSLLSVCFRWESQILQGEAISKILGHLDTMIITIADKVICHASVQLGES